MAQQAASHSRPRFRRVLAGAAAGAVALVLAFQWQARASVDSDLALVGQQLQTFVARIGALEDVGPLAEQLPLGDQRPGDALGLLRALDDETTAAVDSVREALADAEASLEDAGDLAAALDDLDGTYAGLDVVVSGPGEGDAPVVVDGEDVVDVLFRIEAARTVDVPIDFATGLVDLVAAGSDGTFPVTFALSSSTLHFQLDKDLAADPATAAQALSLRTLTASSLVAPAEEPTLTLSVATAEGGAALQELTTNLGFTAISVAGTLAFDLETRLALGDPDDPTPFDGTPAGDQRISADEWTSTAFEDLVEVTVVDDPDTDAVFAQLELDSDLTADDPDVTITYDDDSLVDGTTATPTLDPAVPTIGDLRNFTADEALAAVGRLISMLEALQTSGRLDPQLPFLSGVQTSAGDSATGSFSDALSLGDRLRAAIADPTNGIGTIVDDGSPPAETQPRPAFANAQQLRDKLAAFLGNTVGLELDQDTKRLEFTLDLADDGSATTRLKLGDLDVLSAIALDAGDIDAQLDADYELGLTFGLDLTAQPTEDGAGIGSCTNGVDDASEDLDPGTVADGADAGDTECEGTRTLEQRVAVEVGTSNSPELTARVGAAVDDVDAEARIGMLEAEVAGAHVALGSNDGEDGSGPGSCVDGSDQDGDSLTDMADPDCRAILTLDINEAGGDGWLTVEDVFNGLGANPPAGVTIAGTLDAALDAVVPVSATLGGASLGSGSIVASAGFDGPLGELGPDALLQTLVIDASDLRTTDLLAFSPCGNGQDDDGDGLVNDGCAASGPDGGDDGDQPDPETACADAVDDDGDGDVNDGCPASDQSEASSLALLARILDAARMIAADLEGGGFLPAGTLSDPIPFLGVSFDDLLSYGDTLTSLVTNVQEAGEPALVASGLDPDACTDEVDSDYDGIVDDGCPTAAGPDNLPETDCRDTDGIADDDGDLDINDGCPAAVPSLQDLAAQLDGYLTNLLDKIPDTTGDGVDVGASTVEVVLTHDSDADAVDFTITIDDLTLQAASPFNLDLPDGLAELVSLDAQGDVSVEVVGDLTLAFGLDLATFTPYLRDSTGGSITVEATAADLQFEAGVGPLRLLVGQQVATGESSCGGSTDDDGDGVANDGCAADGDAESACTGSDDDDGDGKANDGCAAVADRGRVHLGGRVSFDQDDVAGPGDKAGLGDASFSLDADGVAQAECTPLTLDTDQDGSDDLGAVEKDACAVLPLYLAVGGGEPVPVGALPDGHHVKAAIEDLGSPALLVDYDTSQLGDLIQGSLIDLLLLNSGLEDLLLRLEQLLDGSLLGFPLPLIGDQLDDAAAIVGSLRAGLKQAVSDALAGGNPLDPGGLVPGADQAQSAVQAMASAIGERLDGDGTDDLAPLLLDSDDAGADVTEADLVGTVRCGDGGARACDTGFGEGDPANPALAGGPDCTGAGAAADDDGDGVANDGCDAVAAPETGGDCGNDADDDGDGHADDGCGEEGDPAADGGESAETACEGTDDDDGDGVANDGCAAEAEPATNVTDVQFRAKLGRTVTELGAIPLNFDASVPGLGLSVEDAFLRGDVTWSIDVGFGISKDHGFYFLTDDADEIAIEADIRVSADGGPPASINGHLAFLKVSATDILDDADGGSSLGATFAVDVLDPGVGPAQDGRLTFGELQGVTSFGKLLNFTLNAGAHIDVRLETGFDAGNVGLPKLLADVHLDWTWGIATMTDDVAALDPDACGSGASCLDISLDNVQLSLGSFVSNFLKPVFADVQRFTKPFDPIIEQLNAPIPVLSDLAGEPITLLTLAETFGPSDQSYDLIIDVVKLVDFVNSLDFTGPEILIPIGGALGDSFDLDAEKLQNGKLDASQARQAFTTNIDGLPNLLTKPGGIDDNTTDVGSSELKVSALDSIGVSFPFIEQPSKMLGVLFGQDVDLVLWEPEPLSIGFSYSQKFGPIWAVPPVFLEIGGSVSVTGTFGIGYSSKGFRAAFFDEQGPAGLLRGLFLADRHPIEGGPDSNELELRGKLFANAQVSVLIFSAGAEGSVFLTIGIDLQDPNGDGRLEFQEAADLIRTTGNVLCIFNLNGQFGVGISAFAEVDLFFWSQRWEVTLAEIILYEFKVQCAPLADPVLASQSGGTLTLHIGPNRHLRDPDGDATPNGSVGHEVVDEDVVVTRTPDGVSVSALGYVQHYGSSANPITKVVADGGTGHDSITLADGVVGAETKCADAADDDGDGAVNDGCPAAGPEDPPTKETGGECADADDDDGDGKVNDGCKTVGAPLPFDIASELKGGPGADSITGGTVADTIDGDGGAGAQGYDPDDGGDPFDTVDADDQLTTRTGPSTVRGGGGNDKIVGGDVVDKLFGDAGNDTIDAGLGADEIEGGEGQDSIDGGRSTANTTIQSGKPGVPQAAAVDGGDIIYGDVKANPALGDKDTIDAGDGADVVYGGPGADRIQGGKGNDTIEGGDEPADAACLAPSDPVDDVIVGGPGADSIKGGSGDDVIVGGSILAGQPDEGDTLLDGGDECDVIVGDNATFESSTDPRAYVVVDPTLGGGDVMRGGNGDDRLQGQVGDDVVNGDDVDDAADAGDGDDVVFGDAGADTIDGDGGHDVLRGGAGDDDIVGGNGNDKAYGESGADILLGDVGSVARGGAGRADDDPTMSGGTGVDELRGGADVDRIYGQGAGDVIYGDGDADELYGDGDDADPAHVAADGNDTVYGGVGDDQLFGNNGADRLYGESGDDRLVGGSGNATSADSGYADGAGAGCAAGAADCWQDRLYGDFGADVLAGDNATIAAPATTPVLLAEATIGGDDLLLGQGANDLLYGENGNDDLVGGDGDDHAEGGDDDDDLYGEAGQDDLIGGTTEHADVVPVGATNGQPDGNDRLFGGGNADVLAGDNAALTRPGGTHPNGAVIRDVVVDDLDYPLLSLSGEDQLSGGESSDEGYGGAERDRLWGYSESDGPNPGTDGDDHLEGNGGADEIRGQAGQDDLIGGTSAEAGPPGDAGGGHPDGGTSGAAPYDGDDLYGGAGHDVLAGDNASIQRVLDGGTDWFLDDLDADRGIVDVVRRRVVLYDVATVDLAAPAGTSGNDELHGEDGHDQAWAQGGNDLLDGGASDDHLEGNDGQDVLYGRAGQDDLIGGTGRTTSDDPATAADRRLDDRDELYGGDDPDVAMGDNATVLRGDEAGTLGEPWTVNPFDGSVKRYLYLYDVAEVGRTPQASEDASGPDLVRGEAGNDLLYGQGEGDDMAGGAGDDHMQGNAGSDTMLGEGGNDDMVGGTGAINDDPPTGRDGRHDDGELGMSGGDGFDWMAGDNAVIRRVLSESGAWLPSTVNGGIEHQRIWLRDVNSAHQAIVSGGDVLDGDAQDDVIYGQANGDDAGPDVNDLIHGNDGDDYLEGNAGADIMFGDADQDDMLGGTGRINGDPATGTPGRWDADDKLQGNDGHDTMAGDNAVLVRQLDGDVWRTQTYRHFADDEPSAQTYTRVARDVITIDSEGGAFSGSDLLRGGAGDDEVHGQLDDTSEGGGYPAADAVAWCELPLPAPSPKVPVTFSLAAVDAEGGARGDILCGDAGEDVLLGDGGSVDDIVETGSRAATVKPNEPFIQDQVFVAESLTRQVTLLQIPNGGDDVLLGGDDGDWNHGGAGNDIVNAGRGSDRSFGGDGDDAMWGGRDHDHAYGGYGRDHNDVRPRTSSSSGPDPMAWFLFAPDDPSTTRLIDGIPHEEYDGYQGIDFIYGGWDQDAAQADVGRAGPHPGDRLMDWAGSYNAYYLCPAVFGERVITRDMSPSMIRFWEDMAKGDGVEPTTVGQGGSKTTMSGFDELAMVYKPDVKANSTPIHPDTPGHFTCDEPLLAP